MKLFFPGQQEDERVHLVTRPHWFIFAQKIFVWLLLVLLLLAAETYLGKDIPVVDHSPYLRTLNLGKTIYIMFLLAALFYIWIIYYLNYQIVTNERVVDFTQKNLLYHTISELPLERIQDVTAEIEGVFGNLLDYGNVYVQTAGEMERFVFESVPNPHEVTKIILDLYERLPAKEKALKE